ncbi:hypothetical protein ACH4OW_20645 [Streptomyces sp. NPDC017056]|uniref:hypothetical protein n=1 Tax=Streptomyces sp. NPDC017056 TaxID=3364973 RepID=UPI00379C3E29
MQRRSFVPGAALVTAATLAATLTACSGSSGSGRTADDTKSGDSAAMAQSAEPGKYKTLPEPCRLPSKNTLRKMLPPSATEQPQDAEKVYAGTADITYDTDRRVGCRWKREAPEGTRHLSLDFERVVSYDPAVSDDDKAQSVYAKKELAAKLPAGPGTSSPPPSAKTPGDAGSGAADDKEGGKGTDGGKASPAVSGSPVPPTGSPSDDPSSTPGAGTAPRVLDGLGDAAFLNDKLITADSGVHRDVTVVFRSSNVIVTITYDQWSTDKAALPDSKDLQDKAQALAQELTDHFNE